MASSPPNTPMPPRFDPYRILFVCHDGDLFGSQQSLLLLLKNLPPNRFQCHVSIAKPGPLSERIAEELPHVILAQHQRVQWIKHNARSRIQHWGDLIAITLGAISRVMTLADYITKHQIDLVHTNSLVSLEGALAAKHTERPHVWHIRELFMLPSPKLHMVLGREVTRQYVQKLSRKVFCISQAVQQQFTDMAEYTTEQFAVVYNALDDTLLNAPPKPKPFDAKSPLTLGYIGRLSEGKRFHDVVEALAVVKRQTPRAKFQLLVAGKFVDTDYETHIHQEIYRHDLTEHIRFLGYQHQVDKVYQAIDVLIMPSLNEPFGRVVIEAMAYGVPCVAANSGGIPEIITDSSLGWLYPATQATELGAIILTLLKDRSPLAAVATAAQNMVQNRFSAATQAQQVMAYYDGILNDGSTAP